MKAFFTLSLVCLMVAAAGRTAAAQAPAPRAGVAVTLAPPLGVGAEIAVRAGEQLNLRAGFSMFGLSRQFDNDGIALDAQLTLRSVSAHVDWFPFGGGFHLSPGVMLYNGNELTARASVPGGDTFDLGGERLISNPLDPVTGAASVSFKTVAPSVRIGWGNLVPRGGRRWSIPFELGVVFANAPTAGLDLSGSACVRAALNCRSIATNAQLQAALQDEQDQLNDDVRVLRLIPVVSLGFGVTF